MDEFDVVCTCGVRIHSSSEHVGRTIRCRCGETVRIQPPAASATASSPPKRRVARRSLRRWPAGLWASWRGEFTHRRWLTRWSARAQLLYLLGTISTWAALVQLSERWLPATLLLYGPRVVVLLPALLLIPLGLLFARRAFLLTVTAVLVAVTQIMGFRLGTGPSEVPLRLATDIVATNTAVNGGDRNSNATANPNPNPYPNLNPNTTPTITPNTQPTPLPAPSRRQLRVITLNSAGTTTPERLQALMLRLEPDVLTLQECRAELARWLLSHPDWYAAYHQSLCTVSRWPLANADSMPRADFAEIRKLGYGGTALAVRYLVRHPTRPFQLVNLHLETARKGLEGLLGSDGLIPDNIAIPRDLPFSEGSERVAVNALIRERESRRTASWAVRDLSIYPVIVSGDFNLPVESTIYRDHWRGYQNAFEQKGRGFGYTKAEGTLLRIRIDHVLTAANWMQVEGAWLGPEVGSDHRPVVADFTWADEGPRPGI